MPRGRPPLTPHLISLRRELHRRFFKALTSAKNKCSHCNSHSCAMRTEGGYKLFCLTLFCVTLTLTLTLILILILTLTLTLTLTLIPDQSS